jgi:hypothetical protein
MWPSDSDGLNLVFSPEEWSPPIYPVVSVFMFYDALSTTGKRLFLLMLLPCPRPCPARMNLRACVRASGRARVRVRVCVRVKLLLLLLLLLLLPLSLPLFLFLISCVWACLCSVFPFLLVIREISYRIAEIPRGWEDYGCKYFFDHGFITV